MADSWLEVPEPTGATRVTRTLAKKLSKRYDIRNAVIQNTQDPGAEIRSAIARERPDLMFCSFSVINPDVILAAKESDLRVIVRCDYKMRDLAPETQRRIIQTYPSADWIRDNAFCMNRIERMGKRKMVMTLLFGLNGFERVNEKN